ncbi:MAG: GxxExxY protein [Bacteroidales bacterium]|nr:GxxExxY protein [Bacteroidales bacterium]
MTDIIYKEESYKINACIFEVNRKLGSGFLEAVYQEALSIEFEKAGIPFEQQAHIQVMYDGKPLKQYYIADFICFDQIIVEIKAVSKIENVHKAQVLNYLKATDFELGLLVNFCAYPKAEIIRLIKT